MFGLTVRTEHSSELCSECPCLDHSFVTVVVVVVLQSRDQSPGFACCLRSVLPRL